LRQFSDLMCYKLGDGIPKDSEVLQQPLYF